MMKNQFTLTFTLLTCLVLSASAQTTGNFDTTIAFNGMDHTLSYHVPMDYNKDSTYTLLVALHGCNGNSKDYRDEFANFADSINAILVCPDFFGDQIIGSNGQLIIDAINETINSGYTVDTTSVYMTGFSCNGQETFKQGWKEIYPFAGLIPLNSWIPVINSEYNLGSTVPTCICSGTRDGSFSNNQRLYDRFTRLGGTALFNKMDGIAHEWKFATRDDELLECFDWFKSLNDVVVSTDELALIDAGIRIYPNPVVDDAFYIENKKNTLLIIKIFDTTGRLVSTLAPSSETVITVQTLSLTSGTYLVELGNLTDGPLGVQTIIVK